MVASSFVALSEASTASAYQPDLSFQCSFPGYSLREQALAFVGHRHRPHEITASGSSQAGPEMIGPTGMAFRAGPLYTNAIMGQAPSVTEREQARKASCTIRREDSIHVEESENTSRPESWSIHFDCTNQAPYQSEPTSKMMTQSSLPRLLKENASHDLAFFLRTTGPTAPHRRASKVERQQRAAPTPKNALRFLRIRQKPPSNPTAQLPEE